MTDKKIVLPGDEVAVEEEYLAAEGTYNENGVIYASQFGDLELDLKEMTAKVRSPNPPNILKPGDIVFAVIADTKPTMATCDVVAKEGVKRGVGGETYGTIHVSKISPGYTEDVSKEFRKNDIIRGKVTQVKPSLQVVTVDPHLGVILARCARCRETLVRKEKGLYCQSCDRYYSRKIADDYGQVVV